MRRTVVALSIALLSFSTPKIWADGIGLTVSGILSTFDPGDTPLQPRIGGVNYFDSANGLVPPGYGNSTPGATAVIGSGIEFGFNDGIDKVTVDFTGTTVTLTATCEAAGCGTTPVTIDLYSPYITGYTMISDNFPDAVAGYGYAGVFGGPSASFTFFGASGWNGGTLTASYTSITPPPAVPALRSFALLSNSPKALSVPADPPDPPDVPEPATFGFMALGLLGLAGLLRKRFA